MSDNPYLPSNLPGHNPGSPPPVPNARERLNGPGLALMITAGIFIGLLVLALIMNIVLVATGNAANLGRQGISGEMVVGFRIVFGLLLIVINVIIFKGGKSMRELENYSSSRLAAILALIPCCGPCYLLGIPFGIWALVVLGDQSVKASFKS